MRLIAFAILVLAGAVVFLKDDAAGMILVAVGAVLGVLELVLSGFWKEARQIFGEQEEPPKPPTEE
jgi:hypothetical protein